MVPLADFALSLSQVNPTRRNTDEMELQRDAITTRLIASLLGVKPEMLLRGQEEDLVEILGQAIGRLLALMALLMLMPPSIHRSH